MNDGRYKTATERSSFAMGELLLKEIDND